MPVIGDKATRSLGCKDRGVHRILGGLEKVLAKFSELRKLNGFCFLFLGRIERRLSRPGAFGSVEPKIEGLCQFLCQYFAQMLVEGCA
ncbi:MAG: hypothetical protein ACRDK2_02230, partial [Solirubrobacteraceae bacterium]